MKTTWLGGLLLRRLVMPLTFAAQAMFMRWMGCELGADAYINITAQYHPAGGVSHAQFLNSTAA